MLRPPSLKFAPFYPVTSGLAAAAIAVTALWWLGYDMRGLVMDVHVWNGGELWRTLTATLMHSTIIHLAFNLYWFWTLGTLVERVYGPLKCAAIYLLLAFGSMLADFAVFEGGVGLSGVAYGLWGMLMMLERHDPRFAGAVDRRTNQIFAVWFVFCIALTVAHILRVANIAHGVGAFMGILLGFAMAGNRAVRWKAGISVAALMILILLGSTVFWPRVNLSKFADVEIVQAADTAMETGNYSRGIELLEIAAQWKNAPARVWYRLGAVYQQVGDFQKANAAFAHAAEMPDADKQMMDAANSVGHPAQVNTNQ
jgi:membrane associated rhomboid family serine protease